MMRLAGFLLFFIAWEAAGQSLADIFLAIPDGAIGINISEKLQLINDVNAGRNSLENGIGPTRVFIKLFEPDNNYLVLSGDYQGSTSLKFWREGSGKVLLALETKTCLHDCESHLRFWRFNKNILTEVERSRVIPAVSFEDFFNVRLLKQDSIDLKSYTTAFESHHLLYILPRADQNIIVKSQFQMLDMDQKLGPYNLGSRLELVWQRGVFKKGRHLK